MTWTPAAWEGFALLLEEWWKDELPDATREAWKLALDDVDPALAVATLKGMLRAGATWRPSTAQFIAALEECVSGSVRSFDEAWPVIQRAMRSLRPGDDGQHVIARVRDAAGDHAAGWVAAYGVWRLAGEPVHDPDFGGAVVHRLREHYTELVANPGARDRLVRQLSDGPRRGQLRRVDAMALLNGGAE